MRSGGVNAGEEGDGEQGLTERFKALGGASATVVWKRSSGKKKSKNSALVGEEQPGRSSEAPMAMAVRAQAE